VLNFDADKYLLKQMMFSYSGPHPDQSVEGYVCPITEHIHADLLWGSVTGANPPIALSMFQDPSGDWTLEVEQTLEVNLELGMAFIEKSLKDFGIDIQPDEAGGQYL